MSKLGNAPLNVNFTICRGIFCGVVCFCFDDVGFGFWTNRNDTGTTGNRLASPQRPEVGNQRDTLFFIQHQKGAKRAVFLEVKSSKSLDFPSTKMSFASSGVMARLHMTFCMPLNLQSGLSQL